MLESGNNHLANNVTWLLCLLRGFPVAFLSFFSFLFSFFFLLSSFFFRLSFFISHPHFFFLLLSSSFFFFLLLSSSFLFLLSYSLASFFSFSLFFFFFPPLFLNLASQRHETECHSWDHCRSGVRCGAERRAALNWDRIVQFAVIVTEDFAAAVEAIYTGATAAPPCRLLRKKISFARLVRTKAWMKTSVQRSSAPPSAALRN